jgi:uncharacterized membrane protein
MTFPSFSAGEILRATDMNAVGMWLVKSQAVGSGVSSVTVTDAFSADWNAYRIIATGVASTGTGNSASLQLSGITTGYYAAIQYCVWASGAVLGSVDNNQAAWNFAGSFSTDGLVLDLDLANPFLAVPTTLSNGSYASHLGGSVNGKQTSATSATGFTVSTPGGTMTGGTINVYGYRK